MIFVDIIFVFDYDKFVIFIECKWNDEIFYVLIDYIVIFVKSFVFDFDWVKCGYFECVVIDVV